LIAQHSAMKLAKKGTSLDSPCYKDASSLKTVERLSVPVIYLDIRAWFHSDLTLTNLVGIEVAFLILLVLLSIEGARMLINIFKAAHSDLGTYFGSKCLFWVIFHY
jgi:hypothetical protein